MFAAVFPYAFFLLKSTLKRGYIGCNSIEGSLETRLCLLVTWVNESCTTLIVKLFQRPIEQCKIVHLNTLMEKRRQIFFQISGIVKPKIFKQCKMRIENY